jgi:Tfp pilus assembly protein FimV
VPPLPSVTVAAQPQPELGSPRGQAAKALVALDVRRRELENRLSDLDHQQRQATEQVSQRSAELADLERRAAAGERVSAQARAKAEQALTQARLRHAEPWAERAAGVRAAIREAEQGKRAFVIEHLDELLGELVEDANAAAEDVNHAAQRLLMPTGSARRSSSGLPPCAGWFDPSPDPVPSVRPGPRCWHRRRSGYSEMAARSRPYRTWTHANR